MLTNRLNHNIFLCFYVFGYSLCWSEKTFCLEDMGILYNGRMKIIIIMMMIIIIIVFLLLFFFFKTIQNFIHRFKKIDYLEIQEYEILKYIPYVHSSCVRKRIVVE